MTCVVCRDRPALRCSDHCRLCRAEQRKAYWKQRYEDRDYAPHIIEAKYIRAVWASNPAKAQRLLAQMRAAA